MKISQIRRLAHADDGTPVSTLKRGLNQLLREDGHDPAMLYQEMEMDSVFVDTHDDVSTTEDTVQLHSHSFYELLYCCSNGSEYLLGTKRYRVQKGDVIYIPPGISHRPLFLEKLAEPYFRYVLWMSGEYAKNVCSIFPDLDILPSEPFVLRTLGTEWEQLGAWFRAGIKESSGRGAGWQAAVCGNTLQLLVQMLRARVGGGLPMPQAEKKELLDELLMYIETHLAEKITLQDTARRFLVSESSINQLFNRKMKVSFYRFVTQRRLIFAKTLLLDHVPAEQVSTNVGFGDYSVFYRAFRREYGISPTQFVKLQDSIFLKGAIK